MSNKVLEEIRKISPSSKNIKIRNISLYKSGRIEFDLICDVAVTDEEKLMIIDSIKAYLPDYFYDINVSVTKIVADAELVAREVVSYLAIAHMSVSHSIVEKDLSVVNLNGVCEYTLKLDKDVYTYFEETNACADISNHLEKCFCEKFIGKIENVGKAEFDPSILKEKIKILINY